MEKIPLEISKLDLLEPLARKLVMSLLPSGEIETYLVGGGVRDLLLGRNTNDVDVLVLGKPEDVFEILVEKLGSDFSEVKITQELTDYLTAKLLLSDAESQIEIDIVFARKEVFPSPAAKASVSVGTLSDDLYRRDYSINALVIGANGNGTLYVGDMVGGLESLSKKELKILHDSSFRDDPVRVLRGLRFKSRLGFSFEAGTSAKMLDCISSRDLQGVSIGRRVFELGKFRSEPRVEPLLAEIFNLGLFGQIFYPRKIKDFQVERYSKFVSKLGNDLGFWAFVLNLLESVDDKVISVLPLTKAVRKEVLAALEGF